MAMHDVANTAPNTSAGSPPERHGRKPAKIWRTALATLLLAATAALVPTSAADAATSTVRVTNAGDLIITATNSRDEVTISQEGIDQFRIQIETDHGEVIAHDVDGVTRHATFHMRGGNDIVIFEGDVTFPGNLNIRWGSGDSILHSWSTPLVEIRGNFTVLDGNGSTSLDVERLKVTGRSRLSLGGGVARVTLEAGSFADNFAATVSSSGELKRFEVDESAFYEKFDLTTGNKADSVLITNSWMRGASRVNLRGGDDTFEAVQSLLDGRANITMGSGNDTSTLTGSTVDNALNFRGDSGDDRLNVLDSTFRDRSTLNGGSGTDQLFGQQSTFSIEPRILGFE